MEHASEDSVCTIKEKKLCAQAIPSLTEVIVISFETTLKEK
jgi:hypothetical protein